jgi:hypothetical protein
MKGEPSEYSCLLCDQPLESISGEIRVIYRLIVEQSTTLKRPKDWLPEE